MVHELDFIKKVFFEIYDAEPDTGKSIMTEYKNVIYNYIDAYITIEEHMKSNNVYDEYQIKIMKLKSDLIDLYGVDDPLIDIVDTFSLIFTIKEKFWVPSCFLIGFESEKLKRKMTPTEFIINTLEFIDQLTYAIKKGKYKIDEYHKDSINIFNACKHLDSTEMKSLISIFKFAETIILIENGHFEKLKENDDYEEK